MADVYRARQQGEGNFEVAVKVYRSNYAQRESFRDYFMTEADKVGQFDHPNILPFLEFGEGEGLLYAVTPYVTTGTLQDLLNRVGGKFSAMQALPIMQQVCSAVQYAHNRDVIHGNIKPSNVFVANDGRMLLADFGIARGYDDSQQSLTRVGWGSAEYTAPEQSLGVLRKASDIYALGVLLFRILTGQVPFTGQTPVEVLLKHVRQSVPSARVVVPGISDAVDGVLNMALQKRADDRFASAEELSNAFSAAVRVAPVASPVAKAVNTPVPQPVAAQPFQALSPQTPIPVANFPIAMSEPQTPVPVHLALSSSASTPVGLQENFGSSSFLEEKSPQTSQPWYGGDEGSMGSEDNGSDDAIAGQQPPVEGGRSGKNRFWSVDPVEWSPIDNGQRQVNAVPLTAEDYLRDNAEAPRTQSTQTPPAHQNQPLQQSQGIQPVSPVVPVPPPLFEEHKPEDDKTTQGEQRRGEIHRAQAQKAHDDTSFHARLQKVLPIIVVILLLLGLLGAFLSSFFFPGSAPGAFVSPHQGFIILL
jgi:serine/threonine protein kinase